MANLLNTTGHAMSAGFYTRTLSRLEQKINNLLENWRYMRAAWRQFHQSETGRRVPCRVWMRHAAMLEVMNSKSS